MGNTVLINPELELLSDDRVLNWEGCLSIPGMRAGVLASGFACDIEVWIVTEV